MTRWTITECERCQRDNLRCLLRAGEWVCTHCVPEPAAEVAGQLSLGDTDDPAVNDPTEEIPY